MASRLKLLALVAFTVVGLDQLTKALAQHFLAAGPISIMPGYIDLVLAYNQGAAFSLLSGLSHSRWLLVGVAVVAVGIIVWMVVSQRMGQGPLIYCMGLILGGAISNNLIDRLRLGHVVDFVDLHWQDLHWPVFNLADSAITIGGVWLAWLLIRGKV